MNRSSPDTPHLPACGRLAQWLGRALLRLTGWRLQGTPPPIDKALFLAAPHTSNWDAFFMLAGAWAFGLRPAFLVKHTVFRFPFGGLFRALGGIPVDRHQAGGTVAAAAEALRSADRLLLLVAPAGTRSYTDHWKSGFYHIARKAEVPLVCSYLDYDRKIAGIGPTLWLTGDVRRDMERIRAAYRGIGPKYPEKLSEMVLREELRATPPGDHREETS